jgi:hypothetical protein
MGNPMFVALQHSGRLADTKRLGLTVKDNEAVSVKSSLKNEWKNAHKHSGLPHWGKPT